MINIVSASAGSGKTYRLTQEYLSFLLNSKDLYEYKHILAVTFTNKATDEMKQRIIGELHSLSESDNLNSQRARQILVEILNDYSSFNISTIDKFFQQTLRAFAREIGQYASYNVELDTNEVLSQSVNNMLDDLDSNPLLLNWLINMSLHDIENGKNWNFTNHILDFGNLLFSEDYRVKAEKSTSNLGDKTKILELKDFLTEIIRKQEAIFEKIGKDALNIMTVYGLEPSDFSKGSKSQFFIFDKWANKNYKEPSPSFRQLIDNVDKWYSKSSTKKDLIISSYTDLNELVNQLCYSYDSAEDYFTAMVLINNISDLGVFSDIRRYISDYCTKNNVMLLSDSGELLNRIIDGSDTPFVYEKIGARLNHYMLDEFQDTSVIQWKNFKPLLQDSLANGYDNLVVGDVKQSIYRWRGADWRLLNNQIYNDFNDAQIKSETLEYNWRSARKVVEFNNLFFKITCDTLQNLYQTDVVENNDTLSKVYADLEQKIPEKKTDVLDGHVSVSFLPCDDDWKELALQKLIETIDTLLSDGYSLNDILILVRINADACQIADYLIQHNYNVISDEALLISSSNVIKKIVAELSSLLNSNDPINKYILERIRTENQLFDNNINITGKSLYEICEELIRNLTDEEKEETIFIQAFLDCVLDYSSRHGTDILGFINWWNESGVNVSVSAPKGDSAINIMTVHKSKGLQAKVVIMPFYKENIAMRNNNVIWCMPSKTPFNMISPLPIVANKSLTNTIFKKDYNDELLFHYVDIINVSYVAFTRAEEELIVFAPQPKYENKIKSMSDILFSMCDENTMVYEIGKRIKRSINNVLDDKQKISDNKKKKFVSIPLGERLKLSYRSKEYFTENNLRTKGIIMHDILSMISNEKELKNAVDDALSQGLIGDSEYDKVFKTLQVAINSVKDRHWFDDTYSHYNEIAVILPGGEIKRPDRVMIGGNNENVIVDYKFGNIHNSSYICQVQTYMRLLKDMGYKSVSGYLWYVEELDITPII